MTSRPQESNEMNYDNNVNLTKSIIDNKQGNSRFLNNTKSLVSLHKAPPDFKDHKVKSSTEYFLPKIKDGLPSTVKNLAFLRA